MFSDDESQRASRELRIMDQVERMDDRELHQLESWLAHSEGTPTARRGITRRELLLGGGATLLGIGAGIGSQALVGGRSEQAAVTDPAPTAQPKSTLPAPAFPDLRERVAELEAKAGTLSSDLSRSNSLLDLYRQLEGIGLDETVRAGMGAVLGVLTTVGSGAADLRRGLQTAQEKLSELDQAFVGLDGGLELAESTITRLSELVQALENGLRAAGEPVRPLTDAIGGFFRGVIERIPSVGPTIIETIDRVEALVSAIPESIENLNRDLVTPLREKLFPREGENVRVRLLEPLVGLIFQPADVLLGRLAELDRRYDEELQSPTETKLEQRSEIRKQIEELQSDDAP